MPEPLIDPLTPPEPPPPPDPAPSGPQPFSVPDDALVSVKIGGKEELVPWSQARGAYQRHEDYTRKTQDLARQRTDFQASQAEFVTKQQDLETKLAQIQAIFSDPQKVKDLAFALMQRQQQPPTPRTLTHEDLPAVESSLEARLQAQTERLHKQWADEQAQAQAAQDLDTFTTGLISQHPRLKALDGLSEAVFARVLRLKPGSLDEAKDHTRQIIDRKSVV